MGKINLGEFISLIWFAIYAIAALVFSFADTRLFVGVSIILMMISCLRIPACIRADLNDTEKVATNEKLVYVFCGTTAGAVALYLVVSSGGV